MVNTKYGVYSHYNCSQRTKICVNESLKIGKNTQMDKTKIKSRVKKSFINGYNQVPKGKVNEVKEKIMQSLSVNANSSFFERMNGKKSWNKAEIEAVTAIFKEYGITNNIWTNVNKAGK